ncbi:MAG: DsbE family thiol:disulfide interchange protein [Betaproteobacteria bacterium]|jgi:cytochrome c biogenesis protein CcmG/thiol:disulfide interchange protein DsbE|nr:DsbE family thiol:disulfide interchange protein [Rubrivivax sp.]
MKSLRFLIPLALFGALAWFLYAGLSLNPREVPSPLIGKPAPAFALPRLDDPTQTVKREDLLGKVWVMNVWASWCAPCREEHPLVVAFARERKVPVIGLNYKDRPGDARTWLERLGNPYAATLIDFDGKVGIDFGVYGVPETFVIDAQGVVRFKHVGVLTRQVISQKIEPLLKELGV